MPAIIGAQAMPEHNIFGPPGTGKTTFLTRQIKRASRKYHSEDVVACSFTSAAARELAGRNKVLPESNIGTIHSICYHALEEPPIAELQRDALDEWNAQHPEWRIETEGKGIDEPITGGPLMQYNRDRATFSDPSNPEFAKEWNKWKEDEGLYDFTDLLMAAPETLDAEVLMVDEAQDLTPLQWHIVRQWGADVQWFVTCGDDDQLLYAFLGAKPDPLLEGDPEHRTILGQSYRVPAAVHEQSQQWIKKLGDRRVEKPFEARDEPGWAGERELTLRHPEGLVSEIRSKVNDDLECMVLASCSYMLQSLLTCLRNNGIAFHNPYRRKRGDWNPLGTTGQRIISFLNCCRKANQHLPARQWWDWLEMVRSSDNLKRGAKKWLRQQAEANANLHITDLEWAIQSPELVEAMENRDLEWIQDNSTKRFEKALEYPMQVYETLGTGGLRQNPHVIVGTIHSVKGGEADVVYLSPDISAAAKRGLDCAREWHREALIRQFYVGMTRAKKELHLLQNSSKNYIYW